MLRCLLLRFALPLALTLVPFHAAAFAQSQDSQSVAEAARRAREQKKAAVKPAKVLTEDDIKPATPAAPASPAVPEAQPSAAAPASSSAESPAPVPAGAPSAQGKKNEKAAKEIAGLKEKIKQAQSDLDLAQRELALEQDTYYSNPDYVRDTAGKAKLESLKQQVSDKQQDLDRLKARLAELQPPQENSTTAPPKL